MIRLPQNVNQIRGENITLRFASTDECGYKMLFEAGSAKLAHRMISLDNEEQDAVRGQNDGWEPARPVDQIRDEKQRAVAALNETRFIDGEGQHCLTLSVGDAISLVAPIEQIKRLSAMGVVVTGHNFTTAEVGAAAQAVLERFENSIQQVADHALNQVADNTHTQELGMFPAGFGR